MSVRTVVGPVLDTVRRSGRPVVWTPEWMGWGNLALGWFWAWRGRQRGEDRHTLRTPVMLPWLETFPAARALTLDRSAVRFLDRRLMLRDVEPDRAVGRYARDFTQDELDGFLDEVLLSSPALRERVARRARPEGTLVVNVRRGDYYTPDHEATFGFDVAGWLRPVLLEASRDADAVHVVSDDVEWCRTHLSVPEDRRRDLTFAGPDEGPLDHLATLAGASRLVLANSTFSYWGGYLATRRGADPSTVWAPDFFMRGHHDDRAWLLDPRWHAVPVTDGSGP